MKVPTFRSVKLEDRATSQFQDNAKLVLDALGQAEILNSVFVDVYLSSGLDVSVSHGLGRAARGFIITKADAPVNAYVSGNDKASPTTLILKSSGSAKVTLLIF